MPVQKEMILTLSLHRRWPHVVLLGLLAVTSTFGIVRAEEDAGEIYQINPTRDSSAPFAVYVPADLDDTFKELSRMLHPKLVDKIKLGTEKDLAQYHLGLGMWMRNNWALWKGSRLSEWFNQKGILEPDNMSGIILKSYWRQLNSRPIELDKQIAFYEEYRKKVQEADEREKKRAKVAVQQIGNLMMGMSVERAGVSQIRMPDRSSGGMRAQYLAQFRGGVLMAIRKDFKEEDFTTPGYFLDLQTKKIHPSIQSEYRKLKRCNLRLLLAALPTSVGRQREHEIGFHSR